MIEIRDITRFCQVVQYAARFSTALALLVIAMPGCSRQASVAPNDASFTALTGLYNSFVNSHRGEPPKDEAEFKAYISAKGQLWLQKSGISDVNSLFVSTRDGQAVVILYRTMREPRAARGVVAYEQTGVDGKRFVCFRDGSVRLVDEQEFARLGAAA